MYDYVGEDAERVKLYRGGCAGFRGVRRNRRGYCEVLG